MPEIFDYDEFFVPSDDPGIAVLVPIRGRQVPIQVKKAISTADRLAAENAGVSRVVSPEGKVSVSIDQDKGALELLYRSILAWPFTRQKKDDQGRVLMDGNGDPLREAVPISRENIAALLGDASTFLYMRLSGLSLAKDEALAPFVSPSAAPS